MSRKFGLDDYLKLAKLSGIEWLGPLPQSAHAKTFWKCPKGHSWEAPFNGIKQGNRCRICRNLRIGESRRLTPADYFLLAETRKWKWLGKPVTSTEEETSWQCEEGHLIEKSYERIKKLKYCPVCSNRLPKTATDYHALAHSRSFTWLGPEVQSTNSRTQWRCSSKHVLESSYNSILVTRYCWVCDEMNEQTPAFLKNLANELNFEWIGQNSDTGKSQSLWRCQNEHKFISSARRLSTIRACATCSKLQADAKIRFGAEDYHAIAKAKNIEWCGGEIKRSTAKTLWRCTLKHEWLASLNAIRALGKCPQCSKNERISCRKPLQDYCKEIATDRQVEWIGNSIFKKNETTTWKCKTGHEWKAAASEIKRGSGCPHCAKLKTATLLRKSPADYHRLAEQAGFTWLGPEVAKTSQKTKWQCSLGHEWEAQFHNISHGTGCPKCSKSEYAKKRKLSSERYVLAANEKNLTWIGPEVTVKEKTRWRCKLGHELSATINGIRSGAGCPICNRTKRQIEFEISKLLKGKGTSSNREKPVDPTFLRTKGKRTIEDYYKVALYRSLIWLGPEVSTTHTATQWQCGCGKSFSSSFLKVMQRRSTCASCSREKVATSARRSVLEYTKLGNSKGFTWLGPEVTNNKEYTSWRCAKGHEWLTNYHSIQSGQGCPKCGKENASQINRNKPSDYLALASLRGFEWLGPEVRNAVSKTTWRCKFNHEWQAQYNNIKTGSGCPKCSKKEVGNKLRADAGDYISAAALAGLTWLGPPVANSNIKTSWKCAQGHKWTASLSSLKTSRSCPRCSIEKNSDLKRLSTQSYLDCAKKRGMIWIGPPVQKSSMKTGWECTQGHRWQADFNHISGGRGCPKCGKLAAANKTRNSEESYRKLAEQKGFLWIGSNVTNIKTPTEWQCPSGHTWAASYKAFQKALYCPQCSNLTDGRRTSLPQRKICDMLGGQLNYRVGIYSVDIALVGESDKIAIEYDAWFWHATNQVRDEARDKYLNRLGWKILRVKSNKEIPSLTLLKKHISNLRKGDGYSEIILKDWGIGKYGL